MNNFGAYPIINQYGYHHKLRIGCVVMFHTSYGMDKYHITNTLKYGGLEYKSSMGLSQ